MLFFFALFIKEYRLVFFSIVSTKIFSSTTAFSVGNNKNRFLPNQYIRMISEGSVTLKIQHFHHRNKLQF